MRWNSLRGNCLQSFIFAAMAFEKKYHWHKIAESTAEITRRGERNIAYVKVAGKEICITHYNQELYACTAKCPHAGGHLHEGWLDQMGNIVCPLHRYRYSVANGRNTSGEGYHLKTYPIRENDDGVFVGIDVGGW
jgi:nitrite reductase/ring-hydroxylating ferredoxin subunit